MEEVVKPGGDVLVAVVVVVVPETARGMASEWMVTPCVEGTPRVCRETGSVAVDNLFLEVLVQIALAAANVCRVELMTACVVELKESLGEVEMESAAEVGLFGGHTEGAMGVSVHLVPWEVGDVKAEQACCSGDPSAWVVDAC